MDHYRCFKCYLPSTSKEVISDTVKFIPGKIKFPQLNTNVYLQLAIDNIISLLQHNQKNLNPLNLHNPSTLLNAFENVATTLNSYQHSHNPLPVQKPPATIHQLLDDLKLKKPITSFSPQTSNPRAPNANYTFHLPVQTFLQPNISSQTPFADSPRVKLLQPNISSQIPLANSPRVKIPSSDPTSHLVPQFNSSMLPTKLFRQKRMQFPSPQRPSLSVSSSLKANHTYNTKGEKIT